MGVAGFRGAKGGVSMALGVAGALYGLVAAAAAALGISAGASVGTLALLEGLPAAGAFSSTGAGTGSPSGLPVAVTPPAPITSPGGVVEVPSVMVALYKRAAARTCPGLPWTVLAAIGTVESGNGTSSQPGVHSGSNYAGAQGPMQFEPATFAAYAYPVPGGGVSPPSPYDPTDAVFAAARMLCANGGSNSTGLPAAVFAYNHASWYVDEVMSLSALYRSQDP